MVNLIYRYGLPVIMVIVFWLSFTIIFSLIVYIITFFEPSLYSYLLSSKITFFIFLVVFFAGIPFAKYYISKREQYGKVFHILAIVELGGLFGIVAAQTIPNFQTIHVTVIPFFTIAVFLFLYRRYLSK